jgi:hypothetical protein
MKAHRLELHEGKLSRAVLRGGGGCEAASLPDRHMCSKTHSSSYGPIGLGLWTGAGRTRPHQLALFGPLAQTLVADQRSAHLIQ